MRVSFHLFFYSAECECCGQTVNISYRDLRACFRGAVPNKSVIERSVRCTCAAEPPLIGAEPPSYIH